MVSVLGGGIPMETQTREGSQFDAGSQGAPQESAGMVETFKNFNAASRSFHCRDIDVSEGQLTIHLGIGDENLMQSRITDLPDEQFREVLAEAVRDALEPDFGWHGLFPYLHNLFGLLERKAFNDIGHLDIVEIPQADTAFETLADFTYVFFFVFQ